VLDLGRKCGHIGLDLSCGAQVGLLGGDLQQLRGVAKAPAQPIQAGDDLFEFRALPAEVLGAIRIVPDAGLLEFAGYFLKAFVLVVVIKDTSSRSRCAPRDL